MGFLQSALQQAQDAFNKLKNIGGTKEYVFHKGSSNNMAIPSNLLNPLVTPTSTTVQSTSKPLPTPTPTPTPTLTATPTPQPQHAGLKIAEALIPPETQPTKPIQGLLPEITQHYGDEVPYANMAQEIWKGVEPYKLMNTMFKESSYKPNLVHVNKPLWQTRQINNQEQFEKLRQKYPSMDIGLMQINTAPAMTDYLQQKGLTYYDLLDPRTNLEVAYDLYSGNIPYTAPGFTNWVAARGLGY